MKKPQPILLLVDGNALFYRAFHAFPLSLTAPDGELINAVYGFTRILLSSIKSLKPTCLAVCFDMKGPTFRHAQYAEYKGTRQKMPEELAAQSDRLRQVVEYLEVPIYQAETFEADDVIGTLAKQAAAQHPDLQVVILTGDQDLMQLVTDHINVYLPGLGQKPATMYGPEQVQERYSFAPRQMIDYKALRGDPSDNIPGVPGIGEVTATKLIQEYGDIDTMYAALKKDDTRDIKAGVLQKLRDGEDSAQLSKKLATIVTNAPVNLDISHCQLSLAHPENLIALFKELGFRSLLNDLPSTHLLPAQAADVFESEEVVAAESEPVETGPATLENSDGIDRSLAPILRAMETEGVMVDLPYLAALETEYALELDQTRAKLQEMAGQEFSPDSPTQIAHILYEVLNLPTTWVRKGKTGFTTDAATLLEFGDTYPITAALLHYREITKLQSTYVKPLQALTDEHSRIHTSYAPDTATGRISSRNPNLQNIPIRSEEGRRLRAAFVAKPGHLFVAADYSQIELRVAAHLADEPAMKEVFKEGRDFHDETAKRMGVDRRVAKIINFSILYGKGAFGFAKDLGITVPEAKKYIEQYFQTYHKLREYLDRTLLLAKEQGYLDTLYGRRRMFPDLQSKNHTLRVAAEREAVNLPVQGSAADILKRAMCVLDERIQAHPDFGKMILTVHDELVLEVPQGKEHDAGILLRDSMVQSTTLSVPLDVHVKIGPRWSEIEEIEL
jgi:DNA polymerase I-like protein with 3'-5' exonuclease and polymerase domains/5'-3' exonuclease